MADISKIQLENQVYNIKDETARESIKNIQNTTANKYIFIGDSYGAGWIDKVKAKLNLDSTNSYSNSQGGYGFLGISGVSTFLSLLQAITINNKEEISHIVVCGGNNDWNYSRTQIQTAIQQFISYCKSNFPNAKIYIGMIGNNGGYTNDEIWVRTYLANTVTRAYQDCVLYGGLYLNGIENIMKNYLFFDSSDYNHPNNDGYEMLAGYIFNALVTGYADFKTDFATCGFSSEYATMNGTILTQLRNDCVNFYGTELIFNYNSIQNNVGNVYFGKFTSPHWRPYATIALYIPVRYELVCSDATVITETGILTCGNDTSLRLIRADYNYQIVNNLQAVRIQPFFATLSNSIC